MPGNLAGALAIAGGGATVTRVDVGYFIVPAGDGDGGVGAGDVSGGTRASAAGAMLAPGFAFRDGRIVTERGAAHIRDFPVAGASRPAFSLGASESFALPRLADRIRDVDVFLGAAGPATRPLALFSAGSSLVTRIPGVRPGLEAVLSRVVTGSTGGPDAATRARA